jgi:hypothetical protein
MRAKNGWTHFKRDQILYGLGIGLTECIGVASWRDKVESIFGGSGRGDGRGGRCGMPQLSRLRPTVKSAEKLSRSLNMVDVQHIEELD